MEEVQLRVPARLMKIKHVRHGSVVYVSIHHHDPTTPYITIRHDYSPDSGAFGSWIRTPDELMPEAVESDSDSKEYCWKSEVRLHQSSARYGVMNVQESARLYHRSLFSCIISDHIAYYRP